MHLFIEQEHDILHHGQGGCGNLRIKVTTLAFAQLQILLDIFEENFNTPPDMVDFHEFVEAQIQVVCYQAFPFSTIANLYKKQVDPVIAIPNRHFYVPGIKLAAAFYFFPIFLS